jgi:hypothetical protein
MTACKITLLATQWLLLSAQTLPEPIYKPRPLTPDYVKWLRSMNYLPPPEFDREYDGILKIVRGTQQELRAACPNSFRPGNAIGCAHVPREGLPCVIYILNDSGLQSVNMDYEVVFRHERAHCLNWKHD